MIVLISLPLKVIELDMITSESVIFQRLLTVDCGGKSDIAGD